MVVIAESESLVGVGIALPPSRLTTCPLCGSGERACGWFLLHLHATKRKATAPPPGCAEGGELTPSAACLGFVLI